MALIELDYNEQDFVVEYKYDAGVKGDYDTPDDTPEITIKNISSTDLIIDENVLNFIHEQILEQESN